MLIKHSQRERKRFYPQREREILSRERERGLWAVAVLENLRGDGAELYRVRLGTLILLE